MSQAGVGRAPMLHLPHLIINVQILAQNDITSTQKQLLRLKNFGFASIESVGGSKDVSSIFLYST